jgi:hypothetical protein
MSTPLAPAPHQDPPTSWFERHAKKTLLVLVLFFLSMSFCISEAWLRLHKTKDYDNDYEFVQVAREVVGQRLKIEEIKTWYTDHEGVYKASGDYAWEDGVKINSEGFRSIEFKDYESPMKKILFLGDSFTWGGNAKPIQQCFVDQVGQAGYLVFNTGIPGTGPEQYAFLAEKYGPLIKPDIIMTMICMGNDINLAPQPMIPNQDLFHTVRFKNTTTMFFAYDDKGNYITPAECLRQAIETYDHHGSTLQRACRGVFTRSMTGTRIWMALANIKHTSLSFATDREPAANKLKANKYVIDSLNRINNVCRRLHAEPMVFLIPVKPAGESSRTNIAVNLDIFAGFNPRFPSNLTNADYDPGGDEAHFNNKGHAQYARFILAQLRARGF